jgi:tRNA(Ile)-lysidine synthase
MRSQLEQSVLKTIRREGLLRPGDRVGVAVSGGADSVALLVLLRSLQEELGITLLVAHFDHGLRGEESEGDAKFVEELARGLRLEFVAEKKDVAAAAKKNGWNLEEAGRRLRYAFFERLVDEKRATRIAVAHTADDQAETVLAHVIRGTGLKGLGGIYPVRGAVVRPLLEVRRQELRAYLAARGQSWREDSTNQDVRRVRARIRAQILPQLEKEFSPQIVARLNELARLAREEEIFWNELVQQRFLALAARQGEELRIRVEDLIAGLPQMSGGAAEKRKTERPYVGGCRPLTERLIRRLYEAVKGDCRGLSAQNVEEVIRLATESSSGKHLELPGGIQVGREFDELIFTASGAAGPEEQSEETKSRARAYRYEFRLDGAGTTTISIPELGSRFRLKVIDWPPAESDTKWGVEALDADRLGTSLILRSWRPGDGYRPRGRREGRKLKEMFRTGRVPSRERGRWPVLESGGRVVWTRGLPPAEEYCAREGTRAGVVIEEEKT